MPEMRIRIPIIILLLLLSWSPGAWAQDRKFEIIPFVAFIAGGSFLNAVQDETLVVDESMAYGFTIDVDYGDTGQVQLLWSHQPSEFKTSSITTSTFGLNIDYFHFGGTYSWAKDEKFKPYVVVSAGATYFRPVDSGYNDEWRFSMGLGLGLKYFITSRIGFMLEGRGYGTFMGGSGAIFCGGGGCQIAVHQELFTQFEGRTGIVFRF
jgi:opacity protein-like surface antigen